MDTIYKSVDTLGSNMDKIDSASKEVANGSKVLKSSLETAINKLKESSSADTLSKDEINKIKEQALLGVQSKFTDNYKTALANTTWEKVQESLKNNSAESQKYINDIIKSYLGDDYQTYGACLQQKDYTCNNLQHHTMPEIQEFINKLNEFVMYVAENTSKSLAVSVSESAALETASSVVDSLVPTLANQVKSATINTLTSSLGALYTGVDKLDSGINELSKGISTFNEEGIKKVTNLVNSKVKGTSSKVKELIKLSNNYDSFTTNHNLKNSSTKFILVIDGKNAPKEEKVVKKEDTKVTFWDRVTNLFK